MRATGDEIAFFDAGGVVLALWAWDKLAEDAGACRSPRPQTFRGTTLAWNCATPAEVDAALRARRWRPARRCCASREKTDYGGYRGYFADPDGHVWEVVQAPGFELHGRWPADPAGLAAGFPRHSHGGTSVRI